MKEPAYADGAVTLYEGDALTLLPGLPQASVQLILVDPPYRNVKPDAWDRQWPTRDAYLDWLRTLAKEWQRILTPNGSLYCFASPQMAAHVEVMLGEMFHVIQRITWRKPPFFTRAEMSDKETCRMFFPASEAIVFCEQRNADSMALGESGYAAQCERIHGHVFEPIRAYLEGERLRAGIQKAAINEACGFAPIAGAMASRHYFSPSQWCLPTQEHYAAMHGLFNRHGRVPAPPFADFHPADSPFAKFHPTATEFLRADYELLRADYELLRADYELLRADYELLRRHFAVSAKVPYTDVWDFATVHATPGKHPCQKPLPLLRHIIECSSRPGDTVLDCMAGSGSTLDAARACCRKAIGIEQDARWVRSASRRLSQQWLFSAALPAVGTWGDALPALLAAQGYEGGECGGKC